MTIAYRNITKTFPDGTTALDHFDLCFEPGEFVVLLGASGCGKSTSCRILALGRAWSVIEVTRWSDGQVVQLRSQAT